MSDLGNAAMLIAAGRHYDALYSPRDPICCHCEHHPVRDASESVYARYTTHSGKFRHEGDLCLECASGIFEEELEEFTEGLMAVFGPVHPLAQSERNVA